MKKIISFSLWGNHPVYVAGALRNAELAHIVTKEAATFGISGQVSLDFGAAFDRSRKGADGRVAGVHFLMKKNKITEIHGYGRFTDANKREISERNHRYSKVQRRI
jgi:pyruvate/2-oxoglutarate dehydrogenase complex dihydrolipoamide dehydrogenase (E3) component